MSQKELLQKELSKKWQPNKDCLQSCATPSHEFVANAPKYGKVIPNRIFVGGIDLKTKEEDLDNYFSKFGRVLHTKIIRDRAEISKGFGFVTFEKVEDAEKVKAKEREYHLHGKKLNVSAAVEKTQTNFPQDVHFPVATGNWVEHPGGFASLTHQNGITYFCPLHLMPHGEQESRDVPLTLPPFNYLPVPPFSQTSQPCPNSHMLDPFAQTNQFCLKSHIFNAFPVQYNQWHLPPTLSLFNHPPVRPSFSKPNHICFCSPFPIQKFNALPVQHVQSIGNPVAR